MARRAQPFDLVLANILPGPLTELAPAMRRALEPGGVAVLSGLLDHQAREVRATYAAAGFHLVHKRSRAGWTALVLVRCHPGAFHRDPSCRLLRRLRMTGYRGQAPV